MNFEAVSLLELTVGI